MIQAVILGEPYPEPQTLSEEQSKQCRAWIAGLGHEEIAKREGALKELMRGDEGTPSLLRESLKGGSAEVVGAVRILLGYDHTPWKAMIQPSRIVIEDALMEHAK